MDRQHTRCDRCRKPQNCFKVDLSPFEPVEWLCRDCVETLLRTSETFDDSNPQVAS